MNLLLLRNYTYWPCNLIINKTMNLIDELILVPIIDDNIKMYLTEIDSITVFICQNPKLKEKLVTTEIK